MKTKNSNTTRNTKKPTVQVKTTVPTDLDQKQQERVPVLIEESAADLERQIARLQKNARAKRARR